MEASAKKHEAIETDILAYEERVLAVVAVAEELQTENYHDIERINARSAHCLHQRQVTTECINSTLVPPGTPPGQDPR